MKKLKFDSYDGVCFLNGLVFFAPVALLVRTQAGVSEHIFFLLQALLSGVIFLGEIPTGFITDKIGYRKSLIWAQVLLFGARSLLLAAFVSRSLALLSLIHILHSEREMGLLSGIFCHNTRRCRMLWSFFSIHQNIFRCSGTRFFTRGQFWQGRCFLACRQRGGLSLIHI